MNLLAMPNYVRGLQYLIYPVLIITGLAGFMVLDKWGLQPFIASSVPVLVCLTVILLLETCYPFRKAWSADMADLKSDFSFLVVVQGIAPKLLGLFVGLLLAQSWISLDQVSGIWPAHWNLAAQTILMILLADMMRYWLHVASHKIPLLWKFHAIHHQPRKLYSINVARFHPTEKVFQFTLDTLPFLLLGVSAEVIACYFVFYAINGFIQHSNLDLRFGFLNYLVSTSELHRWHHDEKNSVVNCNYGNNLIIWDLLFGSYYNPRGKAPSKVGIPGVEPTSFMESLRQPFANFFSADSIFEKCRYSLIGLFNKLVKLTYWRQYVRECESPQQTQNRLLHNILSRQTSTTFGKLHDFGSMRSYADFKNQVGVQDYESLRPYIERQALQDTPELTVDPALIYTQTSGTTGKAKYLPITRYSLNGFKRSQALSSMMIHQACPEAFAGKFFCIASPAREGLNEWGKSCGSASGQIARNMPSIMRNKQLLPPEVLAIQDCDLKYDVMLLLALAESRITFVVSANPSTLLQFKKLINRNRWYYLDLLSGASHLSDHYGDQSGITRIDSKIKCTATRIVNLRAIFTDHDEVKFANLWPDIRILMTWTGGSCGIALGAIAKDMPDGCQVMELGYIASEFRGSITEADSLLGMPTLHENFFEFVARSDWDAGKHRFLQLHEIEQGQQYYIFVTNFNGLYRYNINDIVEVSGYLKNTPCFRFVQKGKGCTNITGEKLYEAQLLEAVEETSCSRGIQPVFYQCLADEHAQCYRLYLETEFPDVADAQAIADQIDASLGRINLEYNAKRLSHRLQALELCLLRPGTYQVYKQSMVDQGQREFQFKVMTLKYQRDNSFPFEQYAQA